MRDKCRACGVGELYPEMLFRRGKSAARAGYALFVLSAAGGALSLNGYLTADPHKGPTSAIFVLALSFIIAVLAAIFALAGWFLILKKLVFTCDHCQAQCAAATKQVAV